MYSFHDTPEMTHVMSDVFAVRVYDEQCYTIYAQTYLTCKIYSHNLWIYIHFKYIYVLFKIHQFKELLYGIKTSMFISYKACWL